MLLIAVLGVALALVSRRARDVEAARARAEAQHQLARKAVEDMLKAVADPPTPPLLPTVPETQEIPR